MQVLTNLVENPAVLAAVAGCVARELLALSGQLLGLLKAIAAKTKTKVDDDLVNAVAEALKAKQ